MTTPILNVFRCSSTRGRTYLIVTRQGPTGWSHGPIPEGTAITINPGGEALPAHNGRAVKC